MPQKMSSTLKYMVPTDGMKAVKASDEEDEVVGLWNDTKIHQVHGYGTKTWCGIWCGGKRATAGPQRTLVFLTIRSLVLESRG